MRVFILACALLMGYASPALALSCAQPSINETVIDNARVIFEGVVVAEKKPDAKMAPGTEAALEGNVIYTFQVTKGWKSVVEGDRIEVARNIYWGDGFKMGQAYLIVADSAQAEWQGNLVAGLCGPSTSLQYAGEYIKALEAHLGTPQRPIQTGPVAPAPEAAPDAVPAE